MERFLEVELSRKHFTTITIAVDDQDIRFRQLFDENGKLKQRAFPNHFSAPEFMEAVRKAADKIRDWEEDPASDEIESLNPNAKEEALKYVVIDARTGQRYQQ